MAIETRRTFCRVCHAACPLDVDVDGRHGGSWPCAACPTTRCSRATPASRAASWPTSTTTRASAHPCSDAGRTARSTRCPAASAFDEIAERLRRDHRRARPAGRASYTGTGGVPEPRAPCRRPRRSTGPLGSPVVLHVGHHRPAGQDVHAAAPGLVGAPATHNFSTTPTCSLAVGYNPIVSSSAPSGRPAGTNPFAVAAAPRRREGMKLIVVDPRRTETGGAWPTSTCRSRPGEDPTLLAGMLHVILDEGLARPRVLRAMGRAGSTSCAAPCAVHAGARGRTLRRRRRRHRGRRPDVRRRHRGTSARGTGPNMAPRPALTEHLALTLNVVCGRFNREGEPARAPAGSCCPDTPRRAQVVPPRRAHHGHRRPACAGLPRATAARCPPPRWPRRSSRRARAGARPRGDRRQPGGGLARPGACTLRGAARPSSCWSCSTTACRPRPSSPTT